MVNTRNFRSLRLTGREVRQGGTGGTPLTEEFRQPQQVKIDRLRRIWRDSKAKKVCGIWCADFNEQGCTPFEVTPRGSDIQMTGQYDSKGKSTAWKEIFHVTSATTFIQTLTSATPGEELKKNSTIVARGSDPNGS